MSTLLGYGVPNGTISGILNKNVLDTRHIEYRWETSPSMSLSDAEQAFNSTVPVREPDPDANPRRTDGLRWIPKVNGEFSVPVVTLHNLGDLFVPFSMQQIYARRAKDNGSAEWLVQRAIRAVGHCDFTVEEEWNAFQDMVAWATNGIKPAGDDVLDPAEVSQPNYGCQFTTVDRPWLAPCP